MEIKKGMYVRTRYGVCKITEEGSFFATFIDRYPGKITKNDILSEPSFNIIEVIEEGDYVDGYLINSKDDNGVYHGAWDCYDEAHFTKPEDVHTIVTKEQFAAMAYEVKHD